MLGPPVNPSLRLVNSLKRRRGGVSGYLLAGSPAPSPAAPSSALGPGPLVSSSFLTVRPLEAGGAVRLCAGPGGRPGAREVPARFPSWLEDPDARPEGGRQRGASVSAAWLKPSPALLPSAARVSCACRKAPQKKRAKEADAGLAAAPPSPAFGGRLTDPRSTDTRRRPFRFAEAAVWPGAPSPRAPGRRPPGQAEGQGRGRGSEERGQEEGRPARRSRALGGGSRVGTGVGVSKACSGAWSRGRREQGQDGGYREPSGEPGMGPPLGAGGRRASLQAGGWPRLLAAASLRRLRRARALSPRGWEPESGGTTSARGWTQASQAVGAGTRGDLPRREIRSCSSALSSAPPLPAPRTSRRPGQGLRARP